MVSWIRRLLIGQKIGKHKNLVNFFKPLYILLSLLGLFPYTIKFPTKRDPVVTPKSLILNSIGATVMSLLLCGFCVLNVRFYVLLNSMTKTMMQINFFIENLTLIASGAVAYVFAFKNRKAYIHILNKVASTWAKLTDGQVHRILKYFRLHVNILVYIWLPTLMTAQTIMFFVYQFYYQRTSVIFRQIVFTIVPEIVSTAAVGCFYILVQMVVCLMKYIEQQCEKLQVRVDQSLQVDTSTIIRKLSELELAYVKTLTIKRVINRAFAAPILLILLQGFHSTLRQAHALYHGLVVTRGLRPHSVIMRMFCLLYPVAKMAALSFTGAMLKGEEMKIGQTLHNIPTQYEDQTILLKIKHFATLMQFHGTEISIYGFFSLDATLLFNIVASVCTYLIILVQFEKYPDKHVDY